MSFTRALIFALLLAEGCTPPVQIVEVQIAAPPPAPASTAAPTATPADPPDTPRARETAARKALWSFVNAYGAKRYEDLVTFIPNAQQGDDPLTPERLRAAWEGPMKEQVATMIAGILAALRANTRIDVSDDTGAMSYGSGDTVTLIFEDGRWKVKDL